MDFDYKKYSLEQLENWMHDAMSAGEASAEEIYNTIKKVVEENYYTYKHQTSQAYELLALLNGNGKGNIKEYDDCVDKILSCDKDDQSPECRGAWNSFWEENYYPEEYSQYTEEELNAMCDKAASDQEKQKCLEYNLREAEYYNKNDKVKKWVLPVEVDGLTGDCFVNLPDDLLEAANLKEGDQITLVDNGDGSFSFRKFKTHDEMIVDGWIMTADGFWIKEN